MKTLILSLIAISSLAFSAKAGPPHKTISDYLLELPKGTFEVDSSSIYRSIQEGNGSIDAKNGFIFYNGDAVDTATQIALFTSRNGPPVLAISSGDYMGTDFNHLRFFVEGDMRPGSWGMVPANRMMLPVPDSENIRFDLPQYGVTVSIRTPSGELLSSWTWNGRTFYGTNTN
jgi:hypothetical protein